MGTRELFFQHLAQTSPFPLALEIEYAEGIFLFDKNGKKYIDMISGIGVSSIGHRHPKVVKALKEQIDKHLHVMVYGEFIQSPQVQLAHALAKTLPPHLQNVFLVNSGSEAIEGALKLAKRYTGRTKIVACTDAYHGSSHGALSASGNEKLKNAFRPLVPGFSHISFGSEEELSHITEDTAAVIIETVQGEAGVRIASKDYFKKLRSICDQLGVLLILDEIQCGFGRTGFFWAFENYQILPDILVSAKGMGGGMPIGCFISTIEIMQSLTVNPILGHITTFGGHPVSAASSLATLQVIQEENLLQQVKSKEDFILNKLQHPSIKQIRSCGLMMAVEFESFEKNKSIIDTCIQKGVLSDWFLFCDYSMRIAPPLTISYTELEFACDMILESIESNQ